MKKKNELYIFIFSKSLKVIEILAMQIMFVRPFLLVITSVLWTDGKYNNKLVSNENKCFADCISV